MRYVLVLVLVAGCRSIFGISDPALIGDAGTIADTNTDGGDAPMSCTSFSTLLDTCALLPGSPWPPGATLYNTDTGELTVGLATQPIMHVEVVTTAGDTVDVVPIASFTQDNTTVLRVIGKFPVALVATGDIEISGHLDVAAGGAGAGCDVLGVGRDGMSHGTTGDGGGGGGGAVMGATGGASGGGNTHTSGGAAQPGFAGGCAGGDGGLIDTTIAEGGGVIYVISAQEISVSGLVDASGAGGKGGVNNISNHGGGGGGASGGSLIFEAPIVMTSGQINATGGGGGGGTAGLAGSGSPGKLGSAGGQGGAGASNNNGGRGGNGTLNAVAGADGGSGEGGGGGGGATGRIHFITEANVNTGVIAPPPL